MELLTSERVIDHAAAGKGDLMKKKKLSLDKDTLRALESGSLRQVAGGIIIKRKDTVACPTASCPPPETVGCPTEPCTSTSNCPDTGDSVYDCTYLCTVCPDPLTP